MKVRSLVSEFDVDEGQVYEVSKEDKYPADPILDLGIDVVDNVGDIYFLLEGEYEIVEE